MLGRWQALVGFGRYLLPGQGTALTALAPSTARHDRPVGKSAIARSSVRSVGSTTICADRSAPARSVRALPTPPASLRGDAKSPARRQRCPRHSDRNPATAMPRRPPVQPPTRDRCGCSSPTPRAVVELRPSRRNAQPVVLSSAQRRTISKSAANVARAGARLHSVSPPAAAPARRRGRLQQPIARWIAASTATSDLSTSAPGDRALPNRPSSRRPRLAARLRARSRRRNTRRRNTTRSASDSSPWLQSSAARSVWCRRNAVPLPPAGG